MTSKLNLIKIRLINFDFGKHLKILRVFADVQGQPVHEPILIPLSVNRLYKCIGSHTHVLYHCPRMCSLPSTCYDHALVEGIFLHDSSLKTQHAPHFCFTTAVFRLQGLCIVSWVVMKVTSPPPTISTWCHKQISKGQLVKQFRTWKWEERFGIV